MSALNGRLFLLWYVKDYSCAHYVAPNTIGIDPLSVAHIRVPITFKVGYNFIFGHKKIIENFVLLRKKMKNDKWLMR